MQLPVPFSLPICSSRPVAHRPSNQQKSTHRRRSVASWREESSTFAFSLASSSRCSACLSSPVSPALTRGCGQKWVADPLFWVGYELGNQKEIKWVCLTCFLKGGEASGWWSKIGKPKWVARSSNGNKDDLTCGGLVVTHTHLSLSQKRIRTPCLGGFWLGRPKEIKWACFPWMAFDGKPKATNLGSKIVGNPKNGPYPKGCLQNSIRNRTPSGMAVNWETKGNQPGEVHNLEKHPNAKTFTSHIKTHAKLHYMLSGKKRKNNCNT